MGVASLLVQGEDSNLKSWESAVSSLLLAFAYRHVATTLEDAQHYAVHRTQDSAASVSLEDVQLAASSALTHSFTEPLSSADWAALVTQLNAVPLPPVPSRPGLVFPTEGTLLQPTYQASLPFTLACTLDSQRCAGAAAAAGESAAGCSANRGAS
jgi:hypothetical protein